MSHVEITIREACIPDSSEIAAILHALGWLEQFKTQDPAQTQAQIAARIAQCLHEQTHTILVAECVRAESDQCVGDACRLGDGARQVIGYISVHWFPNLMFGYDGYVSELFIHPDHTGQGVGSRLLQQIEAYAMQRGCTRLLLMN